MALGYDPPHHVEASQVLRSVPVAHGGGASRGETHRGQALGQPPRPQPPRLLMAHPLRTRQHAAAVDGVGEAGAGRALAGMGLFRVDRTPGETAPEVSAAPP